MTTEDVIRRTAEREKMFENCSGAVLAVSGGSDSMTLLSWFISNSPVPFAVGHVNHGLRKESDDEQKVLEAFCREKNVRIFSKKIDIPSLCPSGVSTETFAREKRYEFLNELRKELGYSHIFTAHNRNDNVETILLNLIRGAGSNGACGIPPLRDDLVARPLIDLDKKEIVAYCIANGLPFAHDKTNDEPICRRNVLRNEIIPQLRELNPSFDEAVARFIGTQREQNGLIEEAAQAVYAKSKTKSGLSLEYFREHGDAFLGLCVRRAFEDATDGKKLSKTLTDELCELVKNGKTNARLCLTDGITAEKSYSELLFLKDVGTTGGYSQILRIGENVIDGTGVLTLTESPKGKIPKELLGRLEVRPAKSGDKIKIRESAGTKSVLKLYSDTKMPTERRKTNPVIVCGEKVVHVCGYGTDAAFAVQNGGLTADFTVF